MIGRAYIQGVGGIPAGRGKGYGLGFMNQGGGGFAGYLAPENTYGLYYQAGNTSKVAHVFTPINKEADCFVQSFQPNVTVTDDIQVGHSGITKGYYITNSDSKTGTWGYSYPSHEAQHTTEVGATMTLNFTGTSISLYSYTDNRGGLWSFSIDNNPAILLSVYRADASYLRQLISDELTYGEHTIIGTFMGDDPDNVPSGGAGTGRGWMCENTTDEGAAFHYKGFYVCDYLNLNYIGFSSLSVLLPMDHKLCPNNARDFAISMRKVGAIYDYEWVPNHDTTTCIAYTKKSLKIDDIDNDLSALTRTYASKINSAYFIEKFTGFNNNDDTENLISVEQLTTIYSNGVVRIKNDITALQDIDVSVMYISMLPFSTTILDNFVTSQGNEYVCGKTDNSETDLVEGSDFYWGYATTKSGLADNLKNLIGIKVQMDNDPWKKADGKNKRCFIWHREVGQKLYMQVAKEETISAGDKYSFTSDYIVNRIDDAYNIVANKFGVTP